MKRLLLLLLVVLPLCMVAQSCNPDDEPFTEETERPLPPSTPDEGEDDDTDDSDNDNTNDDTPTNREITIHIGDNRYTATLEDNPTARAFAALLPMTVTMTGQWKRERYVLGQ